MNANVKSFVSKWNNKTLEDWGCTVSKEFKSFQTAFINAMKKIAENNNAQVVKASKGHYDVSGFIKSNENGKYVYFSYSNGCGIGGRTHIVLKRNNYFPPMYVRTAESDTDYHGGTNHNLFFEDCEETIARLLR